MDTRKKAYFAELYNCCIAL